MRASKDDLETQVERDAEKLAESIREYSRSQREYWRLVPYLALEADGRSYSDPVRRNVYLYADREGGVERLHKWPGVEYVPRFSTDRNWELAYTMGYWRLEGPSEKRAWPQNVYVDLDSGELVDGSSVQDPYVPVKPAETDDILYLAGKLDNLLNAEALVSALSEAAKRPEYNGETNGWRAKERKKLRRKHRVKEVYFRHSPKELKERPKPQTMEEYYLTKMNHP